MGVPLRLIFRFQRFIGILYSRRILLLRFIGQQRGRCQHNIPLRHGNAPILIKHLFLPAGVYQPKEQELALCLYG